MQECVTWLAAGLLEQQTIGMCSCTLKLAAVGIRKGGEESIQRMRGRGLGGTMQSRCSCATTHEGTLQSLFDRQDVVQRVLWCHCWASDMPLCWTVIS